MVRAMQGRPAGSLCWALKEPWALQGPSLGPCSNLGPWRAPSLPLGSALDPGPLGVHAMEER